MKFPVTVVVALGVLNTAWGVHQDKKLRKEAPWLSVSQPEVADIEQFPFQVAVIAEDSFFCAGSLVTPKWVMTTASCTSNRQVFQLAIGSTQEVRQTTRKVIPHPDYVPESQENDLALVELLDAVTLSRSVGVVHLPSPSFSVDKNEFHLSGWASLEDKLAIWAAVSAPTLKYIDVRGAPDSVCATTYGQSFSSNKICLSTSSSPHNEGVLALADGGAPILYERGYMTRDYVQVGVLSSGPGHTTLRLPVLATNVSKYLEWIQQVTTNLCVTTK